MIEDMLFKQYRAGKIDVQHFTYVANYPIATFIGVATLGVNITIQNDSDMLVKTICLASYSAAGVPVVMPDYLFSLTDLGSGRQLQDQPVHVNNITGNGQWPYRLPAPMLWKGGSTILATLQNLTPVAARVDIAFAGYKVFYMPGYQR